MSETINRFMGHLEGLRKREDRGALAMLRRGLGKPPGTVPDMYPHVVPYMQQDTPSWEEKTCYIIGSLFANHPLEGGHDNMGYSLARLRVVKPSGEDSVERRFVSLLNCHSDDLSQHLRQIVGLLKSNEIPIDWRQLFRDILYWDHPDRYVQNSWARAFWGGRAYEEETLNSTENSDEGGK